MRCVPLRVLRRERLVPLWEDAVGGSAPQACKTSCTACSASMLCDHLVHCMVACLPEPAVLQLSSTALRRSTCCKRPRQSRQSARAPRNVHGAPPAPLYSKLRAAWTTTQRRVALAVVRAVAQPAAAQRAAAQPAQAPAHTPGTAAQPVGAEAPAVSQHGRLQELDISSEPATSNMAGLQLCFLGTSAGHPTKFRCAQTPVLAPARAQPAGCTVTCQVEPEP